MFGKSNLARHWRVVATGLCFLAFLGVGLVLTVTVLPLSSFPHRHQFWPFVRL